MNIKMTTNSKVPTTEPKKTKTNYANYYNQYRNRNGDHMESYQCGWGRGRMGETVQGIRSITGRYNIDRKRVSII